MGQKYKISTKISSMDIGSRVGWGIRTQRIKGLGGSTTKRETKIIVSASKILPCVGGGPPCLFCMFFVNWR